MTSENWTCYCAANQPSKADLIQLPRSWNSLLPSSLVVLFLLCSPVTYPFIPEYSTFLRDISYFLFNSGNVCENSTFLRRQRPNSIESTWGTSIYLSFSSEQAGSSFSCLSFSLPLSFPPAFPLYRLFTTLAPTPTPIALCLMLSSSVPSFYK